MLLDAIKEYSVVMPELLQYLKKRGYDPGYFFTKLDLSLQFIIIFEFTTPNVMGVRAYVNRTTDKQDVIFVCPTPETYKISNNHYETLISKAFEYIQNTAF